MATNLPPSERINWRALAGVCIAKNESNIIGVNLRHLYRYGLRQFVFADNGSTDNTVALVEEFRRDHLDATVVILSDHTPYLRPERRDALCAFAARFFSVEWVFPFDADDFLWLSPGPPIELELAHRKIEFISLPWLHLHPVRHPDLKKSLEADVLQGATRPVSGSGTKVFVRWSDNLAINEGAHDVLSRTKRFLTGLHGEDIGMACAHYPIRSADQLATKMLNGTHTIQHWKAAADILAESGASDESPLYDAFANMDFDSLSALCARFGIVPRKLDYIHDMMMFDPISFPQKDVVPQSRAPRIIGYREKNKKSKLTRTLYKYEFRLLGRLNAFRRR